MEQLILSLTILFLLLISPRIGKKRLVKSLIMTDEQYTNAENDLVDRLQMMREAELGSRALLPKSPNKGEGDDTDDDVYEQPVSSERQAAYSEWMNYCRIVKKSRKFPKKFKKEGYMEIGEIKLGQPEESGDALEASHPFVKCNLADYFTRGYFDLVAFLLTNKISFPYIYKLVCCLSSLKTNEVGCERFFSIAGYVSNPRRTCLNVRHYESLAMLKRNMQHVFINEDWVVKQYMMLEKSKGWEERDNAEDKLVTDLERELYAGDLGIPVASLPDMEIDSEDEARPMESEGAIDLAQDSSNSDTDDDDSI